MKTFGVGKRFLRLSGALCAVDGLLTAALGRRYVRLWRFGADTSPYAWALDWLSDRPGWLLRAAGLAQAGLGLTLLGSAPVSVPAFYGASAGEYQKIETIWREWFYTDGHRALDQAITEYLPLNGDVLDLACGTGANLARILDMGLPYGSYTGVDLTEQMLAQARTKGSGHETIRFRRMDLQTDALPGGPYDLVISTWAFEHLSDPASVVDKAWQVLRPGGYMVLLFEISTDFCWGKVVDRILRFFSARHVPEGVWRGFPGLVEMTRYRGAFGDIGLFVLHKPVEEA